MSDEDDHAAWQDESFKVIRIVTAVVVEYSPLVTDPNTPAGWALADLRSVNLDLLQAAMDARREAADQLLIEARALLVELLRLVG